MVKKDTSLDDLFLHEKPAKILVAIKSSGSKTYASTVAKITDCTYSHTVKILDFLKKTGLVDFEKKGRIKFIKLTQSGEDVAIDLENLLRKFSRAEVKEEQKTKKK